MKKVKRIVVAGGTGLIGKHVVKNLRAGGYNTIALSSKKQDWDSFQKQSTEFDVYINLSGRNILKNPFLTKREKEALASSRFVPTQKFVKAIQDKESSSSNLNNDQRPLLIIASAVGYYPTTNNSPQNPTPELDEYYTTPAPNFFGQLCNTIEAAADFPSQEKHYARVVKLRFPVVLADDGGLFPNQALQYKLGFGGKLGTGRQSFPWVHIDDIVNMITYMIENEHTEGIYNAVAPDHVTQNQFSQMLAQKVNRWSWFHIPEFLLRWLLGERAPLLVEGAKINSTRTKESGYHWLFPTLSGALDSLLGKKST